MSNKPHLTAISSNSSTHSGYVALVRAVQEPLVLIDENYCIVAANSAYAKIHGIQQEEAIGRHCYQVSHARNRPCHEFGDDCPHQQVFKTHKCHEVEHQHCDGHGEFKRVRIHGEIIPLEPGRFMLAERVIRIDDPQVQTMASLLEPQQIQTHPIDDQLAPIASPIVRSTFEQLYRVAQTNAPVLLLGESGVGKEMAACYVHRQSQRHHAQMITIDCTTLTETLFEAELFGHEAGAYTGANRRAQGLVEQAHGGTLFLDEIGELPLAMQAKLLRVLEQHTIRRVGGRSDIPVDFRIIAATNRDLEDWVKQGRFRADLYYRLACISLTIPSLRERPEDILPLAEYFLRQINPTIGRRCCQSESAREILQQHHFPGNIRELKNRVQRAITLAPSTQIEPHHLGFTNQNQPATPTAPPITHLYNHTVSTLAEQERMQIEHLLSLYEGHRGKVAQALGISERTLYRKLKKLTSDNATATVS